MLLVNNYYIYIHICIYKHIYIYIYIYIHIYIYTVDVGKRLEPGATHVANGSDCDLKGAHPSAGAVRINTVSGVNGQALSTDKMDADLICKPDVKQLF